MLSLIVSLNLFALMLLQQAPTKTAARPSVTPTPAPSPQAAIAQGSANLDGLVVEYLKNIFVAVIWILFFAAVIALVRYLRRIPNERRQIAQVGENYDDLMKTAETDPAAVREELLKNVDGDSVVAERVEELHVISVSGGDFDQVALSEVLAARVMAKTSIAKYVASVLVLLGLCGAIYGLSDLVLKMGDQLAEMQKVTDPGGRGAATGETAETRSDKLNKDINQLISTMSSSLSKTRGAFFASLTGILLSVVLLFLNWFVGRRQVALLSDLEALTATKLIPVFKPPPETRELAEVVSSFKEGSGYLVRLSDELDDKVLQVSGSLENLFAVVRKFGEGAEALQVNQDRVYEAQVQMLDVVRQFTALTERIEAHQSGAKETADMVVTAVRENSVNLTRAVEEWQKKHESLLQLIQNSTKQAYYEAAQSRETVEQAVRELSEALRASMDQQLGQLRAQTLEMLDKQQVINRTHLAEVVADNGRFIAELQESVRGNGHGQFIEGVARSLEQDRHNFAERLEAALTREREMFAEGINRLSEQNQELIKAVRETGASRSTAPFTARTLERPSPPQQGAPAFADQSALVDQVEELRRQAGHVGAALSAMLALAGGAGLSFVVVALLSFIDLWPEGQMGKALTFSGIVLSSLAVSVALSYVLRRKSLAER